MERRTGVRRACGKDNSYFDNDRVVVSYKGVVVVGHEVVDGVAPHSRHQAKVKLAPFGESGAWGVTVYRVQIGHQLLAWRLRPRVGNEEVVGVAKGQE